MEYTLNELRILWHLKRQGGSVVNDNPGPRRSLLADIAEATQVRRATVSYILKGLETKCLILRTYMRGGSKAFPGQGGDPLIKVELIDKDMYLPPQPGPMPLATVIKHENEDLYEMTACEPTSEAIIVALLSENEKLRFQINKLQEIVNSQAKQIQELQHRQASKPRDPHVTQQIQDALPPEVWDQLHHRGRR